MSNERGKILRGMKLELEEYFRAHPGKDLVIHHCSMCNYPCAFSSDGKNLFYDSGCDCVKYSGMRYADWDELDFYLDDEHGHLENIRKFMEKKEGGVG